MMRLSCLSQQAVLVSFATTGEKTVAAVMSPKNKTVSLSKSYIQTYITMCKLKQQVCCLVCLMCLGQVEFNQQIKMVTQKQTNFTTSVFHSTIYLFICINRRVRYTSVVCILLYRPAVLTSSVPKLDEDSWTQH